MAIRLTLEDVVNDSQDIKIEEMVCALDEFGNPLGKIDRKLANRIGLWHLCVQIIAYTTGPDNNPVVVFQRRSKHKSISPGVLDFAASGHVEFRETSICAAQKELREELGIKVDTDRFELIGRRADTFTAPDILSRIFADVYLVQLDANELLSATPDPTEVEELVIIEASRLIKLSGYGNAIRNINARVVRLDGTVGEISVDLSEFLERRDNLYARIGRTIEDRFTGKPVVF